MKRLFVLICLLCFVVSASSKVSLPAFGDPSTYYRLSESPSSFIWNEGDSIITRPGSDLNYLIVRSSSLKSMVPNSSGLKIISSISPPKELKDLSFKNIFTQNIFRYFLNAQSNPESQSGARSVTYFEPFSGKKIASINFVRLRPFGTSLQDTTLEATRWIEKSGNRLHMSTAKSKLRMHLLFKEGDRVNPLLMAENEKFMRDLGYLEDVSFRLEPVKENQEEVNLIVVIKDKFEYGVNIVADTDNSNLEFFNENMFGMGHRLNLGFAQKNAYLPEMGIYASYQVNNILGKFINSSIGFSDTYLKKGWNLSLEKTFLTSKEENAGGFSYDHVAKYNYISENHPVALDTTVAYNASDLWFSHAFPVGYDKSDKALLSVRYYHQAFNRKPYEPFGANEFLRNHDFFISALGFSNRKLYKNNLVYGYGVTEDIPYGHYYEIKGGLDKSQFGVWPYLGFSLSNAFIGNEGSYYYGKLAFDGFLDNGAIRQGALLISGNFFSKKMYAFGDPFRQFVNIEFLGGINRFKEENVTIDGQFGIRDFYASDLKGKCRLKFNLETVRYLKWNLYGFRFTNYFFTDFAFLSDNMESILKEDFYAGAGAGFRIFNESLVFKIIDIRLTWFPVKPPDGRIPFGANLQGLTKSKFDDFLGRKSEVIRYQ